MEFFKTIADFLQDGQQLQMAIRKSGENIAVSILPDNRGVKDKAVENITPIVMSGSPDEFEEGFANALKPLQEAQNLVSNIKEFEENTEKAKRESEMSKKLKDEADKQKKKFSELIALARKNNEEHKFKDARAILSKAAALPAAEKTIIENVNREIDNMSGVGNMFGGEEDKSDGTYLSSLKNESEVNDYNEEEKED